MKISLRCKMFASVSHIMKSLKETDGTLSQDKYTLSFTLEAAVFVIKQRTVLCRNNHQPVKYTNEHDRQGEIIYNPYAYTFVSFQLICCEL